MYYDKLPELFAFRKYYLWSARMTQVMHLWEFAMDQKVELVFHSARSG